jgi:hypothetical protein
MGAADIEVADMAVADMALSASSQFQDGIRV